MISANRHVVYKEPPPARPSPDQPGTLAEQLAAVGISLYLAERRGTTAAIEWQDARALAIPHAAVTVRASDPPRDPRCSDPGRGTK